MWNELWQFCNAVLLLWHDMICGAPDDRCLAGGMLAGQICRSGAICSFLPSVQMETRDFYKISIVLVCWYPNIIYMNIYILYIQGISQNCGYLIKFRMIFCIFNKDAENHSYSLCIMMMIVTKCYHLPSSPCLGKWPAPSRRSLALPQPSNPSNPYRIHMQHKITEKISFLIFS